MGSFHILLLLLLLFFFFFVFVFVLLSTIAVDEGLHANALGSMSSAAAGYGGNGPCLCELRSSAMEAASRTVDCYGSDGASVLGAPLRLPFSGLTAGDGFICGLTVGTNLPYCWGNNIYVQQGTPSSKGGNITYSQISAGDNHLCALRRSSTASRSFAEELQQQQQQQEEEEGEGEEGEEEEESGKKKVKTMELEQQHAIAGYGDSKDEASASANVDCWGYNMTASFDLLRGQNSSLFSLTSGALFSCGLLESNRTPLCWGDDTGSGVLSRAPKGTRFRSISAGGYHVCGIMEQGGGTLCWGRELEGVPKPSDDESLKFSSLVGGKFHACGLLESDRSPLCWGLIDLPNGTRAPKGARFDSLVAGDYYTCGLKSDASSQASMPLCWGSQFPADLPTSASTSSEAPAVANACSAEGGGGGSCASSTSRTSSSSSSSSMQAPVVIAELAAAAIVVAAVLASAIFLVRYKLSKLSSAAGAASKQQQGDGDGDGDGDGEEGPNKKPKKRHSSSNNSKGRAPRRSSSFGSSFRKERIQIQPELDYDPRMARAESFSFEELEQATGGFSKGNEVGKGSFSCVYRGVLRDGRIVAVKRAMLSLPNQQQQHHNQQQQHHNQHQQHHNQQQEHHHHRQQQRKDSIEFRNELDLLSRLNHAHLLTLLGFCDDRQERLLVYEFMANGTLHEQIHGKNRCALSWVRRVTIAVQAARGLEYLHGYACPPVIHRDIKSSNILLDDEWNARVSDFGLSLLGPLDGDSPLSELPAGTLGYLDPEYYRLHYLTTKSDVYSFGVLLLEILSGRKVIDMEYEEGNIVEWAVPRIREGQVLSILDPVLEPPRPPNLDAMLKIAQIAAKCVKMRGKDRPSMDKVTTSLERALATMIGSYSNNAQPFVPTEVVLGSNRLHRKSSQKSSCRSGFGVDSSDTCTTTDEHHRDHDHRNPSSITVPSIDSYSMRRRSVSDNDVAMAGAELVIPVHDAHHHHHQQHQQHRKQPAMTTTTTSKFEIYPSSPQASLYLNSNF